MCIIIEGLVFVFAEPFKDLLQLLIIQDVQNWPL